MKLTRHQLEESNLWIEAGVHVPTRTIRVYGEIDDEQAEMFAANFYILESLGEEPIVIHLNTGGGDELSGMVIYDLIKGSKCLTTIEVHGEASSMGAIILQAANYRLMMPSSYVMIHIGDRSYEGHAENVRRKMLFDKGYDEKLDLILLEKMRVRDPSLTLGKLRDQMTLDTYFTAAQTIAVGLADRIIR